LFIISGFEAGISVLCGRDNEVFSLSRFLWKIRAERSEVWRFSAKPRSGLTLTGVKNTKLPLPAKHGNTGWKIEYVVYFDFSFRMCY
jgi:hypothetical protein